MSSLHKDHLASQAHLQPVKQTRTVVERGASWSHEETRILLSLWGQDRVQRQLTNSKRTRHVWQRIAERIQQHGFERTAEQVRTRVFNMIAEYRRILKDPKPERKRKCTFFDAIHKIHEAKDANAVQAAIDTYEKRPFFGDGDRTFIQSPPNSYEELTGLNFDPLNGREFSMRDMTDNSAADALQEMNCMWDPHTSGDSPQGSSAGDEEFDGQGNHNFESAQSLLDDGTNELLDSDLYQQPAFCSMIVDRIFAQLAKGNEVWCEWVALERQRVAQELQRRREERSREERREKMLLDTLVKMQRQMLDFLAAHSNDSGQSAQTLEQLAKESARAFVEIARASKSEESEEEFKKLFEGEQSSDQGDDQADLQCDDDQGEDQENSTNDD